MDDFAALGAQFRQAREARELSLQDVEKQTRIRLKYLQAIEYGHFQLIDTPIQLQGFLRKYARAVGLDADMIVSQYVELQHRQRGRPGRRSNNPPHSRPYQPSLASSSNVPSPNPALYSATGSNALRPVLALLLALALTTAIVSGTVITLNNLTAESATALPGGEIVVIDQSNLANSSPTPTQNILPTPPSAPVINPGDSLYVVLTVEQRLWLQVITDSVVAFEGILRPGDTAGYGASTSITIRTSNASGLKLLVNNQPFTPGTKRESAEHTFTAGNIPSPTPAPTSSPTASLTPTTTLTPAASITATITNTASPEPPASPFTATFFFTPTAGSGTPTSIPTFGFSTRTPTATTSPEPPTAAPTLTPSPFLPPRQTPTLTLPK